MSKLEYLVYQNSSKLNDSEIRIIQFVINNAKLCQKLSLSELSQKLYVSRSAIFRMCKHLGLSGYNELKFYLIEVIQEKEQNSRNEAVPDNFGANVIKEIENLHKNFKILKLDEFYIELNNAKHIYIYSTGWIQQMLSNYLSHELLLFGISSIVLPAAVSELEMVGKIAEKGDMLFIISYTGNNKEINDELGKFEMVNNKLRYVSFTDLKQNKLASLSDYNFYYPTIKFSSRNDVSFILAYTLVDFIINKFGIWQKEKSDKNGK
ncbi:MurR/RpiR family transcriptional regulator [Lactobacillus kullabergensis]|uniref:MurR/RpiR family transcriptional regulator n=1 Tax=Lactobacillus TaxID=1578 RepID=UPI0018DCEC09|nr:MULTISPECIES: MurR/RpiR family transcriptional regulator [Lactobacillus]MBI0120817.1 MurR/RpiR family transcriptional regulator [Lactobacillus sp. M0398]MBI0122715.1 MurR/RpiR family transcriptional regulator [Lactobacillus sp. W8174]MBI0135134.1 MurR/RpiR family transcriptional regulator [Lactobacillus sp. W8173]MCX0291040.1 MurR/RpiR family transcriptional regulator [Lactobacillus kullabergensis]